MNISIDDKARLVRLSGGSGVSLTLDRMTECGVHLALNGSTHPRNQFWIEYDGRRINTKPTDGQPVTSTRIFGTAQSRAVKAPAGRVILTIEDERGFRAVLLGKDA